MLSVPITTKVVSLNPVHDKVYSIQHSLCDEVYQLLATGRWFSPGIPVSSTNKTDRHDIAKILLKVELNTINQTKLDIIQNKTHDTVGSVPTLYR